MVRLLPVKGLVAAVGLAAALPCGFGQAAAPSTRDAGVTTSGTVTPAASPVLAPKPAEKAPSPNAPKRTRAISPEVAAALAAVTPKYTPPEPKPEPKPEAPMIDLRDVDKPKNEIVRLPDYVVRERKPPVFRERDVYTDKGITDIAMRRYISDADRALNRWTLPLFGSSKEDRARAMYAEDERLKNMNDLRDASIDAGRADPRNGEYIYKEAQKTFLRSSDFGWSSGEPR